MTPDWLDELEGTMWWQQEGQTGRETPLHFISTALWQPATHKAMCFSDTKPTHKPGMVVHAYHPSPCETGANLGYTVTFRPA